MGKLRIRIIAIVLTAGLLAACGAPRDPGFEASPTPEAVEPTATATSQPSPGLLFVNRLSGWDQVVGDLRAVLTEKAADEGWPFQEVAELPPASSVENQGLIVIAGGEDDLAAFIAAMPAAKFILIAVDGAQAIPGMAVIGPEGLRPDQLAFISGYLSAMVTSQWRTGVLAVGNNLAGQTAAIGFVNGATFFCGLCRPAFPPFHAYPASALSASADAEGLLAGYEQLAAKSVKSIGLSYQIPAEEVSRLMENTLTGQVMFSGPFPPAEALRNRWLATIQPDPASQLESAFELLEAVEEPITLPMDFALREVNKDVLTPGKIAALEAFIEELVSGRIDTGVDPKTGEPR